MPSAVVAAVLTCLLLLVPSSAQAEFGFKRLDLTFENLDGSPAVQAGSHPFAWTTTLELNTLGQGSEEEPDGAIKDLRIALPPGLVGTPSLVPRCSQEAFAAEACAKTTHLGTIELRTDRAETEGQVFPLFNLAPLPGRAAELGFMAADIPVKIRIAVNPDPPYNLIAAIDGASQAAEFFGAVLTIYGAPGGNPFLTLPRSCTGPLPTSFEADSWEQPGAWTPPTVVWTHDDLDPPQPLGLDGCAALQFEPSVEVGPTTAAAGGGSGLDLSIDAPDPDIVSAAGIARADLHAAVFHLPAGMAINPAVAEGLSACGPADLARETAGSGPGVGCPEASKVGTALVESPVLEGPLAGSVFVAQPDNPATAAHGAENPFDSLLALYVVFKDATRGIVVKQAIRLDADPGNGRLTAAAETVPQLPFAHMELHLRGGARSPLVAPPTCGDHAIGYRLTPSSGAPAVEDGASFQLTEDCEPPRFQPSLSAGATETRAGAASTFVLDFSRKDREQNPLRATLSLPEGVSADLAAVATCPEDLVVADACPAASRVGSVRLAVGVGPAPVWIPPAAEAPGAVFLAGPYEGAPFSFAIVVPGRAGPLDLGAVVLRAPVFVDPGTAAARIRIGGLPQILRGVPIPYRTVRLILDRPGFLRNPTSCAATAVHARLTSISGAEATSSNRFQVGGCARLPFKPRLGVRLLGPVRRGAHPRLRIVLRPRPGDANVDRLSLSLPGAELLDSRRIRAVCKRSVFAAGRCPAGAVYGHAKAWSPLLERPLEGRIYLRESEDRLPALAVALRGRIGLDLIGRIEGRGQRLRTTFAHLPDTPLSKVVLTVGGEKRGLFVNSGGLCAQRQRVQATLGAHSGKLRRKQAVAVTSCRAR